MNRTVVETASLRLDIVTPSPDLAPYISTYYRTIVKPGCVVEDWLPPEWANLRAGRAGLYEAAIGADPMRAVPATIISGPTSRVTRLKIGEGRFWGAGLLPLGFAAIIGGLASDYADRFCDAAREPAGEHLEPMLARLAELTGDDIETNVALMNEGFRALIGRRVPQARLVTATHRAIVSDRTRSVAALSVHLGWSTRTLERFCRRYYGFNPQLLLRRQRFLRSLSKFMLDPSLPWIDSLDGHYHDQAQFVRDFKRFMTMKPSEFAAMEHPIADTAVRARSAAMGEPMQVLHRPEAA